MAGRQNKLAPPAPQPALPGTYDLGAATRVRPCRARWVQSAAGSAVDTLGPLARGERVCGVTKGQFGLTELIRAICLQTGPADVVVWTWSIHDDDGQLFGLMRRQGLIRRFTALLDRSFPARQPLRVKPLADAIGDGNIYAIANHAKVALISNESGWRVVLRGSMNCNQNRRPEQFDIDDDAELWGFWMGLTEYFTSRVAPGLLEGGPQLDEAYKGFLGGLRERVAADGEVDWSAVGGDGGGDDDFDWRHVE